MDDALAEALAANPGALALRLRYEALLEAPAQSGALPDPMLSLSFMLEDVVTANGPSTSILELSQEIPFRGKRKLRSGVSEMEAQAAEQAWQAARLEVAYQVRAAYADLFRVDRSMALVQAEADVLDRLEAAARSRYAHGQASQGDVLRAQTERSLIEEQVISLQEERETAAAMLNAVLNRSQSTPLGAALQPPPVAKELPPDEVLFALARDGRPEVAAAAALVEAGRLRQQLAQRGYYPDFRVGAQWNQIGATSNPFAPDPGQDAYMVTVGLTLPVWRGKLRAGVREAQATMASAESQRQDAANRAEAEVRLVLSGVRTQQRLLRLYATTLVPQAEASWQAAEVAYRDGAGDFSAVLDSERQLLALRLAEALALGELGRGTAALERAVGRDLASLAAPSLVSDRRQP